MSDISTPVYLARQPIVDRRVKLCAYELLYRRALTGGAGDLSDAESARSLVNALIDIGLNELVGQARAFINVDEKMLLTGVLEAFPKDRVVLELLEHMPATEEVIAEVRRLRKRGYTIALDDFLWNAHTEALLPFAEIVKIDISQYTMPELAFIAEKLKARELRLLAERVETREEKEATSELGFELFQGYFFAKPEVLEGKALSTNQMALVRLLSRMNAPDLTLDELEAIVVSEVQLNVRLLRFMRSAYFGLPPKVDSIRKMLLFVGLRTLAAVATVLMLSQFSDKPSELIHIAMVRAKFCEHIGQRENPQESDKYFTVGMLSLLDALLDLPMREVLAQLPLTEEIETVLLCSGADSPLSRALSAVMSYEAGDFAGVEELGFDLAETHTTYRLASRWANDTQEALAA